MKTLKCSELGGPCNEELSAEVWGDMVKAMTGHVLENHPDTAKAMQEMHTKDPNQWNNTYQPKWDAAPTIDLLEEKEDETELPEENEMAKENMFGQDAEDWTTVEDPNAPRIFEDR